MEQCSFPRCRQLLSHTYMGRNVCVDHWVKLCDTDGKTEKKMLKKIGLVRDDTGAVVPIVCGDNV